MAVYYLDLSLSIPTPSPLFLLHLVGELLAFLSVLTTHQAASWKAVSGFPEGGARAPVCGRPLPEPVF